MKDAKYDSQNPFHWTLLLWVGTVCQFKFVQKDLR